MSKDATPVDFDLIRGSKNIADALGISQPTLLKMAHSGEIPVLMLGGQIVAIRGQLAGWLWGRAEDGRHLSTRESPTRRSSAEATAP